MGVKNNKNLKQSNYQETLSLSPNLFDFKYIIGKGGFGKVWKVVLKKTGEFFALKEMSKAKIIDKKSEKSIKYERDLLVKLKHPFIVNMHFAFQDKENLYLVMDLLTGGDLRYHISKQKKFTEEQTKFFICCLVLGLEYLHTNNVLHRDIKPENLVLDNKGYVRITDFGIAKIYQKKNSLETSGTPGYMSPEVIIGKDHNEVVDYFAVGVITFEFMMGYRPYNGKSRKDIKEKILSKQVEIKKNEIPSGWSNEVADFINKLLQKKPANRLGLRSSIEVKEHPWIRKYNWKDLYEKKLIAPFIPPDGDNFDSKYCGNDNKLLPDVKLKYDRILRDPHYKDAFLNFTYYGEYLNDIKLKNKGKFVVENGENSICEKFINPHENIENWKNVNDDTIVDNVGKEENLFVINEDELEKNEITENKMKKKKQQTVSSTNSALKKQYNRKLNQNNAIEEINELDNNLLDVDTNNIISDNPDMRYY